MGLRKTRRHGKTLLLVLLPVTILLWFIGWTLFWTGSKNGQAKTTHPPKADIGTLVSTDVLLQNYAKARN